MIKTKEHTMLTIYKASAGSGKTYTLVKKYLGFLLNNAAWKNPRSHRRVLAVTFTHKATNEMKSRILKELNLLATAQNSDYRSDMMSEYGVTADELNERARITLIHILQDYSGFSISTIDGFFQHVVRSFVRELGMSGTYAIELDSDELLVQAIDAMFFNLENNEPLMGWLAKFTEENIQDSRNWNPRTEIDRLAKEIFTENYQTKLRDTHKVLSDKPTIDAYRKTLRGYITRFEEELNNIATDVLTHIEVAGLEVGDFKPATANFFKKIKDKSYKKLEAPGVTFIKAKDAVEALYTKTSSKKAEIEALYASMLQNAIERVLQMFEVDIVNYNTSKAILSKLNTLAILSDISVSVDEISKEENIMPIARTNELLHRIIDGSDAPFVYEKTGIAVQHFMIDEFQDTSRLQWSNFRPLIENSLSEGNQNLIVGDVKQSIYRWRSSDWTLLDTGIEHDSALATKNENLGTNYRSTATIVNFNNELFKNAAEILANKLGNSGKKIRHAYDNETLHQECHRTNDMGYVQLDFIPNSKEEKWEELVPDRLLDIISDLQERHFPLHHIAILARKKGHIQEITQLLISNEIPVVTNEGLLLAHSASVRFMLGIMRGFINNNDPIMNTCVYYEYAKNALKNSEGEALATIFGNQVLFDKAQQDELQRIKYLSLYDMVEQIINLFHLRQWDGEYVYVQAFLDAVFAFTSKKKADLNHFFIWWDKQGEKLTIPMAEVTDAVQVMTIHKSKGLEFDAVIIPYCDWKLDEKSSLYKQNILWYEPRIEPFSQLPLVPVEYSNSLQQSIFKDEFELESLSMHIDNLNLLYVALTRPETELYCIMPLPKAKTKKKDDDGAKTIASLVYECTNQQEQEQVIYGQKCIKQQVPDTQENKTLSMSSVQEYHVSNKMDLKLIGSNKKIYNDQQSLGLIMHDILCHIIVPTDQEQAIASMLNSGRINSEQEPAIRAELDKFWKLDEVQNWFAPGIRVMNEASILTPNAKVYRPDRVMMYPDKSVVVVDYKFGKTENKNYVSQVLNYKTLIEQMGYDVRAYLCYVELEKVVEVAH